MDSVGGIGGGQIAVAIPKDCGGVEQANRVKRMAKLLQPLVEKHDLLVYYFGRLGEVPIGLVFCSCHRVDRLQENFCFGRVLQNVFDQLAVVSDIKLSVFGKILNAVKPKRKDQVGGLILF